mgnify:CR=1 FL=1
MAIKFGEVQNNKNQRGQLAAGKQTFGPFGRYAVAPVHTRFEAVEWFRRTPNAKVQVSVWNTESEDDYRLVDSPIRVEDLITATFLQRPFDPKNDTKRRFRVVR